MVLIGRVDVRRTRGRTVECGGLRRYVYEVAFSFSRFFLLYFGFR